MWQFLIGLAGAAVIAFAAKRVGSLSASGAWGALLTGTIIFGLGGWQWAILLLAFFLSSSLLTRAFRKQKAGVEEKFDKGGKRDLFQVLANGGLAALFAGLHFFLPQAGWTWMGFAASLAAVNADTWATELGVLDPSRPRLITSWKTVDKGTSGGVSLYGTLAAFLGALFIALFGAALGISVLERAGHFWVDLQIFVVAGLVGALFDSFLGATVQAIYRCPKCGKETEKHPLHSCGSTTEQVRGLGWVNNDMVNLACAALGGILGVLL